MRFRTMEECALLVADVNQQLDIIEKQRAMAPTQADTYEKIAARYEVLSEELLGRTFSSPSLTRAVKEYASLLGTAARTARSHATALGNEDRRRRSTSKLTARNQNKREKILVNHINAVCHPR